MGRPGAVVIAAAISRWAARLDGVMTERLYRALPHVLDILAEVGEPKGDLPPLHPASFTCHTHRPDELRSEAVDAGLVVEDLVGVEGHTFALPDLAERLADDLDREVLLDSLRRIAAGARAARALPAPPRRRPRPLIRDLSGCGVGIPAPQPDKSEEGEEGLEVVGDGHRVDEHREVAAGPVVRAEHRRPAAVAGQPGGRVVPG